jgi:sugar phosphate isomerase/epimerase
VDTSVAAAGVPRLAWFPVRFIQEVSEGRRDESAWLRDAERLGFGFVELHQAFVSTPAQVGRLERALRDVGLGVAMITGASDLVHPSAEQREREIERIARNIEIAAALGAPSVRITAGIRRAERDRSEGFDLILRALDEVVGLAERASVTLCFENHYRDRTWPDGAVDFAAELEPFLELARLVDSVGARINYDSAQPMVVGTDELALLQAVIGQVSHVHLGDRRRGSREHSVLGEGDVRIAEVLTALHDRGYDRFISIEDGNREGEAGLERGVGLVRRELARRWAATHAGRP